ncbi:MAG: hypothetical protein JWQ91_2180 [Aeromicrobium sp.]|uniref:DUF5719 family protein n=1 Tax=Aeromicrobium sp. TaxID=1871063 RepID=UPI00262ACA29|nr:DUF5719 family protein [Aeromicrobium sp.]MCW2825263.1 hypothetical protein [Aeromicrobium sp.]
MTYVRSLALPLVAVVLVVLASLVPGDEESPRRPTAAAVTQTTYACPTGSAIEVAAGQVEAGTSASATVLPDGSAEDGLADSSRWRTQRVAGQGVIVQQQGRGSGAVGYFSGTAPTAGGGGLVVGQCPGVVDDSWLLGLGSGEKHLSTLILTNLEDTPAVADLTLWGAQGRIEAVDARGVVVEPRSVRRIPLADLAAGESELAVQVHRRRGSLSAVANDSATGSFRGTEPISATATPRRVQVVSGLVEGTEGRTLLILNPGTATARVGVEVIGPKSTFTPSGLGKVRVRAGSVKAVTVPKSAGPGEQALRLTSDRPVSATVRMSPGSKDYAYAEAAPALTGPAVVPIDLGTELDDPSLVLSAPGRAASVEVLTYAADMARLSSTRIAVAAGTTETVTLKGRAAYAVLHPKGRVTGAVTYTRGGGLSSLVLGAAPRTVLAPQVRPLG